MSLFWFAIAAMTAVALFFMLAPLVIRGRSHVPGRADFDITVYKDQLIEVDRDLERGLLNNEQAISARTEIERRMLAAMEDAEAAREAEAQKGGTPEVIKEDLAEAREEPRRRPMTSALMVAMLVLVPLGAVGLYVYLGQPKMEDLPLASRERDLNKATEGRAQLVKMISDLEQKIQANPEDPNGWALLGRSYMAMSRPGEAINAYKNLVTLTDRNPEALILMAEAMVTAERGVVTVPALDAFKEVKAADPGDPRAYFYIGLERQQKNDATGAIHEWVALLEHSPSNAQWVAEVRARIEAVATEASVSVPKFTMLPPMAEAEPAPQQATQQSTPSAPGPTQEQMRDAQQMSGDEQQTMIRSMVERLAARLKENPDDLEGWVRLERAYQVLGDTAKAAEAAAQIKRLKGQ